MFMSFVFIDFLKIEVWALGVVVKSHLAQLITPVELRKMIMGSYLKWTFFGYIIYLVVFGVRRRPQIFQIRSQEHFT